MIRLPATRYIPPTADGIATTLRTMATMARNTGSLTHRVAADLDSYARNAGLDFPTYLRGWMAEHWQEYADPFSVELLRSPDLQLHEFLVLRGHPGIEHGKMRGDCDDIAVLGAALGLARGFTARYVAVGTDGTGVPTHVYAELLEMGSMGRWADLDILRPATALPPVTSETILYV